MKKSGIILLSTLTAGLLATGSSHASVFCGTLATGEKPDNSCTVNLEEGSTAYYNFTITRKQNPQFTCSLSSPDNQPIKTRIYGGKNAKLSFERDLAGIQQSAIAITSGKSIPISASFTPSPGSERTGQIKFSLEPDQTTGKIEIECKMESK